jgi:hypothetical protein
MMCSASRYLLIAFGVGSVTASFAGSDLAGWVAAAVAVLGYVALERRFPARFGSSCALPDTEPLADPLTDPIASRADRTSGIELTR